MKEGNLISEIVKDLYAFAILFAEGRVLEEEIVLEPRPHSALNRNLHDSVTRTCYGDEAHE